MTYIEPYTGSGGGLDRTARRVAREVSRHQAAARIRIAAADASTDVVVGKLDDYTLATTSALASVGRVVQVQRQIEQLVPEASGLLAFVVQDHTIGVSELLGDFRHELRRR